LTASLASILANHFWEILVKFLHNARVPLYLQTGKFVQGLDTHVFVSSHPTLYSVRRLGLDKNTEEFAPGVRVEVRNSVLAANEVFVILQADLEDLQEAF
jgi:hypothetical protein